VRTFELLYPLDIVWISRNNKNMKNFFYLLMFIFSLNGTAQNVQQISEADIKGITIISSNSYVGNNLNDYLGVNSDLFLEYGFVKAYVNEYLLDHDKVSLEVYIMGNAPSSFGIYSLSISHCTQLNLFGSFSCISPHHVAAVHGQFYIYASNKSGTQSGQAFCKQLVKLFIDKNPQEIWYAPALIQSAKAAPFTNTLRYYKGFLGLKKGLPSWSDILENINFHMYTINITTQEFSGILARITFPHESSLSTFLMKSNPIIMSADTRPSPTSNGLYRSYYKISSTKILFLECTSPNANIKDFLPEVPDYKWMAED
jgi:hypothetical protein